MAEEDAEQFLDDEIYQDIGDDFDLLDLNEEERAELAAFVNNHDSDSDSGDELDVENLPLFYHRRPQFEWTGGNDVPPAQNDNHPNYSRRSGPVRVLDASITHLEYFNLFYTEQIFRDLVDFVNENARRRKESDPDNKKGDWKMLMVDELKAYYGLVIMKDIIKLDRDAHYWHQGGEHFLLYTRFGNVMSRDRFFQIHRYLYFVDPRDPVNTADKLHKIWHILNSVRWNFQDEYVPHEHVTVDEAMAPFKGHLGFKQFMKDKPVKFGIKLWVLAESVTAYCYNLEVYTGKHEQQINRLMGLSARVVIGLTKPILVNSVAIWPYSDWHQCEDSSTLVTAWKDKCMVYCPCPSWGRTTEHHPMAERSSSPVLLLWLPKPSTWTGLTNWTRWRERTNQKSAWSGTDEWKHGNLPVQCLHHRRTRHQSHGWKCEAWFFVVQARPGS